MGTMAEQEPPDSPYEQIVKASVTDRDAVSYSLEAWQNKVVAAFEKEALYWPSEEGQQEQILIDGLNLNLRLRNVRVEDLLAFYDKYLSGTTLEDREKKIKAFIPDICSRIRNTILTATAKLAGISILARCFGDTAGPMILDAIRTQIREQERQAAHPNLKLLKPPWDDPDEKPQPPAEPTVTKESKQDKWSASITLGYTKAGQPIEVTQEELCSGFYTLGEQGMGKSSLLEYIVYQQMERDECITVFDLKGGDLLRNIIARMPAHKLSKTYLLDLTHEDHPVSYNPFACKDPTSEKERRKVKNSVMKACKKLWEEVESQVNFNLILPNLVEVLIEFPQLTIKQVEKLLLNDTFRASYVPKLQDRDVKDFWLETYNEWSKSEKERNCQALLKRMRELLNDSVVKRILCQRETGTDVRKIDFREAIEKKQIILINLPMDVPSYEYAAPVIGTFLLSDIYKATFSFADTPESKRPGFTLIVDEFDYVVTSDYERFFGKARGFKVKQFLAHQYRSQLDREAGTTTRDATLTAHTVVSFKINPKDARSEITDKFKGLRRRPTKIHPSPLEKKREWQEHESKSVREFYQYIQKIEPFIKKYPHYMDLWDRELLELESKSESEFWEYYEEFQQNIQEIEPLVKKYRPYYDIWKRLNKFLYLVQDQGTVIEGRYAWPNQAETHDVLLDLAEVVNETQSRTEKTYNQERVAQLEQEKKMQPVLKRQLEEKRASDKQAQKRGDDETFKRIEENIDKYSSETKRLADEVAAVRLAEQTGAGKWDEIYATFNAREQRILRAGDKKTGPIHFKPVEKRVEWYQDELKGFNRPYDGGSSWQVKQSALQTFCRSLSVSLDPFPWQEYIRLSHIRESCEDDLDYLRREREGLERELNERKKAGYEERQRELIRSIRLGYIERAAAIDDKYNKELAKLDERIRQLENNLYDYTSISEVDPQFAQEFTDMVHALIDQPIASDKAEVDITATLLKLEKREALISIGSQVYEMETIDLNSAYPRVSPVEFHQRELQLRQQTRDKYCRPRSQVEREIYSLLDLEEDQTEQENEPEPGRGNRRKQEDKRGRKARPAEVKPQDGEVEKHANDAEGEDWQPYDVD